MKRALFLFFAFVGLIIGANLLAWGMSYTSVLSGNDGNIFIVPGMCGMLLCLTLIWFMRRSVAWLTWIATVSYTATLVGISAHVASFSSYESGFGFKTYMTVIYVAFLIAMILRKNYNESPGR